MRIISLSLIFTLSFLLFTQSSLSNGFDNKSTKHADKSTAIPNKSKTYPAKSKTYTDKSKTDAGKSTTDDVYQLSTIGALLHSIFDGDVTFGAIKRHGDFGLGTFNALDGEMVAVDGVFYRIDHEGNAHVVDDSVKTPFVTVKFFNPDKFISLYKILDYDGLKKYLDENIKSVNTIYAFRIEGTFKTLKVRSVPRMNKPYPTLKEVLKLESVFDYENISGTLIGFRMPPFMENLNETGYHFHFLTDDRKRGGHALDFVIIKGDISIDNSHELTVTFPTTPAFLHTDLDTEKKTHSIEK